MEEGEQQRDPACAAAGARRNGIDALTEPPFPMPPTGAEGAGKDTNPISPKSDNDGCAGNVGMVVQCTFRVIAKVCRNDGEKQLFKKICKWIRECPSREAVSPHPTPPPPFYEFLKISNPSQLISPPTITVSQVFYYYYFISL